MNQIGLFLCIYIRPLRAFGRVIDEGRLAFAVGVALLAMFAVQVPRHAEVEKLTAMALRYAKEHPAPLRTPPASAAAKTRAPEEVDEDSDGGPSGVPAPLAAMPISFAVDQFLGFSLFHYFPPLLSLAICFVPAALLILTLWDRMGRFSNVLFHNYLTLLLCALMAWAAAYLAMVNAAFLLAHRPGPLYVSLATWSAPVWWVASLYFLALFVCALRTLMGTSLLHAAGAAAGAWAAGVAGIWVYSITGNVTWYLACLACCITCGRTWRPRSAPLATD